MRLLNVNCGFLGSVGERVPEWLTTLAQERRSVGGVGEGVRHGHYPKSILPLVDQHGRVDLESPSQAIQRVERDTLGPTLL